MVRPSPDPRVMATACPRCGAQTGEQCYTKGGSLRYKHPHLDRRVQAVRDASDKFWSYR